MQTEDLVERVKLRVGRPAATLLAVDDPTERRFIGELTFSAVVVYLLSHYLAGFVEGLGVKQLGQSHAKATLKILRKLKVEVLEKLRKDTVEPRDIDIAAKHLHKAVRLPLTWRDNAEARAGAERVVIELLVTRGLIELEARDIARAISEEVLER